MEFHLRQGTADDVPLILRLIKGLAEYEQLAHQVMATEASLRESLFGSNPADLFVLQEWRGRGLGRLTGDALHRLAGS